MKLNRFESINFQRFLRRNVVLKAVAAGKVILALVALSLLGLLAFEVYSVSQATDEQKDLFSRRLAQVEPTKGEGERKSHAPGSFAVIAQRSMFGPLGQSAVQAPKPTPRPVANTQFVLIGTFLSAGDSFAIIEEQKRKTQETFLLKDSVFGEATLTGIFSDRVELSRNGQIEILTLDTAPDASAPVQGGVAQVSTDEFTVEEAELDRALENLPLLLTQARAVPFFKEGRAVGLRLFAIRAGSLFEKIGLQNGDVLKSVNGNSLGDLSQAMQLFQKLKEERNITVTLERNSMERQFRYDIR